MNRLAYLIATLTLWFCSLSLSWAQQQIGVNLDFFGYADNREFKTNYTEDKTFFGTTLSPNLYLALDSSHRIYAGLHYNQDFGKHDQNKERISPIAYYNFQNKNIDFALGLMPRYGRLDAASKIVLSDTFLYHRPNIEGLYFSFRKQNIQQAVYVDWLSKQSPQHRERFVIGLFGKYTLGNFYFTDEALLYHNALTNNAGPEQHIQDNGVVLFRIGSNLSGRTFLDSLTVDAGAAIGFDRVRTVHKLRTATGFISDIHLGYKQFFLHNMLYLGESQNLPNGDSFYRHRTYNRLDLGWMPFRTGNIDGRFTASFHFTPGQISNQQAFTLRCHFGRSWP